MRILGILFLWAVLASGVLAQSDTDTFYVRVFGGTDAVPPTTPTLLTATPITPTQINLTWSTATDNFLVSGYVITRGSTTIATTTLTNFSDTGLTASTTYTYSVRAFDSSLNYSSSSNSLSTTTPNVPPSAPPTVAGPASQATLARLTLQNFSITPGYSTTSITFNTARPTKITVRWGRTGSYELGFIEVVGYSRDHVLSLFDLEPGTTYQYEITGVNDFGTEGVLRSGQFRTAEEIVPTVPSNVGRFAALANGDDVDLSWQLPTGDDIAYVRIVRSHLDWPAHPHDGAIVYQGLRTQFTETGILALHSPVYYTAFVYDQDGNVSSGAIALVYASPTDFDQGVIGDTVRTLVVPPPVSEATSSIDRARLSPEMNVPGLTEIYITQNDQTVTLFDLNIELSASASFLFTIPVHAVSRNLKTIIGSITDPTDTRRSYAFLLRLNQDGSAYEALVPPLMVSGAATAQIEIYDYEAAIVAQYTAPITLVHTSHFEDERSHSLLGSFFKSVLVPSFIFIVLLLFLLFLLLMYRHRKNST